MNMNTEEFKSYGFLKMLLIPSNSFYCNLLAANVQLCNDDLCVVPLPLLISPCLDATADTPLGRLAQLVGTVRNGVRHA